MMKGTRQEIGLWYAEGLISDNELLAWILIHG